MRISDWSSDVCSSDLPSHSVDRNRIAISSIGSWRRGRLMIEDVPLSEGIDQLRRYYSGAIVLTSSELGDRRVTGVFDVDDPDRKSVVSGKSVSGRVDPGGRRFINKKKYQTKQE